MSINASIKSGKAASDNNDRLSNLVSTSSHRRRENILKKKRESAAPAAFATSGAMPSVDMGEMETNVKNLYQDSSDPAQYVESTRYFRKLLSADHYPPIDSVINTGLVPRFVQFLSYGACPDLQYEAAWVLTNIASGNKEQTASVVDSGAIPIFIQLLQTSEMNVCEQCLWALGNIAGDSYQYRDAIINSTCIETILHHLDNPNISIMFLKNAVWLLSNLCRTRDGVPTNFQKVSCVLPYMYRFLTEDDEDVVTDACWCFAFVTDSNRANSTYVIGANVIPAVMPLLSRENVKVVTPALRLTQYVLNQGAIQYLEKLLNSSNFSIVKEATWCMSNITAGTPEQIQLVIDDDLFPVFLNMVDAGRPELQKEACWVIGNAICGFSPNQLWGLCNSFPGVVAALLKVLPMNCEARLVKLIIESFDRLFTMGEQIKQSTNSTVNMMYEAALDGGIEDILEQLVVSDDEVYNRVSMFMQKYFELDEEEDDIRMD